jgi:predicted glycosyltransferase involved in capsule biosynthesis
MSFFLKELQEFIKETGRVNDLSFLDQTPFLSGKFSKKETDYNSQELVST